MENELWQYKKWKNYIRSQHNYFPHLRTAYAYLCKKVPKSYLKYNNTEWFEFQTDLAFFICICELCNNKYAFVKNELIHYNRHNQDNNFKRGYKFANKNEYRPTDRD